MKDTKTSAVPLIILSSITVIAIVAGLYFSGKFSVKPTPQVYGTFFTKPLSLTPFSLNDHNKQTFDINRLKGKWTFIFFGYTNCPDICPQTMGEINNAAAEFSKYPKAFSNTQYVFVSVDPTRDTSAKLAIYVKHFGKDFIGVTGKPSDLLNFAYQFKTLFKVEPNKDPAKYKVTHGGRIMLVNPDGKWVAMFRDGIKGKRLYYNYADIRRYFR